MEKPICDIPNCRRKALKTSIFCGPHERAGDRLGLTDAIIINEAVNYQQNRSSANLFIEQKAFIKGAEWAARTLKMQIDRIKKK